MAKLHIDPIEGKSVRLRLLTQKDLALTLSWRNQDEIRKWFFYSAIIDLPQHQQWFQEYAEKDNDFTFIIEEKKYNNKPIGQVAIYNVDWQRSRCEFGRLMIGDGSARAKGFAKESTSLAIKIADESLNMKMVYLEVYVNNTRAIQLYRKCGFREVRQTGNVLYMERSIGGIDR